MRKSKAFGSFKSFLSSILPAGTRLSLLRRAVEKRYHAPSLVFPYAVDRSKRLLIIAPADPLPALHQLTCVASLAAYLPQAHIAVLCERKVTPFYRTISGVKEFIEYDLDQRYLFSKEFDRIGKDVQSGGYDVCLMLDSRPDLSLLYLAGQSAASVRVGLAGAGEYPFLNLHLNPAPGTSNLTDRSLLVAAALGIPVRAKTSWSVSKESVEEVGQMLREVKIDPEARLIGIDGCGFFSSFGKSWTQTLVDMLLSKRRACYFYCFDAPDAEAFSWMERQGLPVFSNLPVSRGAALVHKSEIVVAGPGVMFELADLLRTPVAGVFTADEFGRYCKESETTWGVRIDSRPDQTTVESVGRIVDARLSPASARPVNEGAANRMAGLSR